ncbi:MAG: putative sugar nucleotidyl transferase [candidate division WOR-3 bacterium]
MIFVYEDEGFVNLQPLVHFRATFDLLCGRRTLLHRLRRLYPRERVSLIVRPELADRARELHPVNPVNMPKTLSRKSEPKLFISGRALLRKPIPVAGEKAIFTSGGELVGFRADPFRVPDGPIPEAHVRGWNLPTLEVEAALVRYPWDIIALTAAELTAEPLSRIPAPRIPGRANIIGKRYQLSMPPGAMIDPGATIDLRAGPVILDRGAEIRAGSVVAGPCYIGPRTIIDGAMIRPGCAFGPDCRIGGEVEASVFLGYANKHHEGFIGHSVIGEWVNLGAMTSNSDLRNDYGEISVMMAGQSIETGLRKLGCIIGDHAKTAIGTMINTGTIIGIFANWFEPGLTPKTVPAFAWGSQRTWELAAAIQTARTVMARRGVVMTDSYEQLIRSYHNRLTR